MAIIKKLLKAFFLKTSGVTVFHLTLIRATNHIRWYYRHFLEPRAKHHSLPPVAFDYPDASLDETDRLIARRIVTNFQGEAFTPDNEQVYLPGLIREMQGYTLLQRSLSPMRRGYAEEIYALSKDGSF